MNLKITLKLGIFFQNFRKIPQYKWKIPGQSNHYDTITMVPYRNITIKQNINSAVSLSFFHFFQ
jgi:hypothetical protein